MGQLVKRTCEICGASLPAGGGLSRHDRWHLNLGALDILELWTHQTARYVWLCYSCHSGLHRRFAYGEMTGDDWDFVAPGLTKERYIAILNGRAAK